MKYDILCLSLMILAFAGGFQKGIIRTFAFFLALLMASAGALLSAPYILSFIQSSVDISIGYLPTGVLLVTFLTCFAIISLLLRFLWVTPHNEDSGLAPRTAGGLLLASIMLLSISVITNFMENSSLIGEGTKDHSHLYGFMEPISERTGETWIQLKNAFQEVRKAERS